MIRTSQIVYMENNKMAYLYEKIETLRENGLIAEVPSIITDNIKKDYELRPYQYKAFENFITYFENENMRQKPTQVLFHMATGAGKTLIMGGLILFLYKKGYRNFLFFVNLSNIVRKTKDNFMEKTSSKYLFNDDIVINHQRVNIREVNNFQDSDDDSINICFTTTQALHYDMQFAKENGMSIDDFENERVVLISDKAHHLNVEKKRMSVEEEERNHSWEATVKRIFELNTDNILLEFTATCDLENASICASYQNKIIVDYPLKTFRKDGYSKEIKTLRSDLDVKDRALQALILSQYRYKLFQDNRINIKPIVFFKSRLIKENNENIKLISEMIQNLTGSDIERIFEQTTSETIIESEKYFKKNMITNDILAAELKDDFSEEHFISANDNDDIENKQIVLNSLEDAGNPYRAVFAVDKLNEGWDVLNLFDIVRLYETRDGKNGIPGKTTIKEAQLIGRGARYCPFIVNPEQEMFKRKYDMDSGNPLRTCEVLFYHCWNEPRYISELHTALKGIGLDPDDMVERTYKLKDTFKEDSLYKNGMLFVNDRLLISRNMVNGLSDKIRDKLYIVHIATGIGGEDVVLEEEYEDKNSKNAQEFGYHTTIKKIAELNYSIVFKALCKYSVFKFNILKQYFPNLKSSKEFIFSDSYLGKIRIDIISKYENPMPELLFKSCLHVLDKIAEEVTKIEDVYKGTTTFYPIRIAEVFKNKKCNYLNPCAGGRGISQKDISVDSDKRLDLSTEDWFAFDDNYGTSEEKAFVKYFKSYVDSLKTEYDKVFLVRNERQFHLYAFDDGGRFEPDYVLFLHKNNEDGFEQLQVFIEPKGTHLISNDAWKEKFLLQMKEQAIPVKILKDDNSYFIWGFHFFNTDMRMLDFGDDMNSLLKTSS